ncbi:hypothetical protein J2Y03_002648 [Neobacillus niacini]|nr:hypothetical protein [Neobacillus niacini]MDR7077624.1 hypothetical protein [Neobacillus niacini]
MNKEEMTKAEKEEEKRHLLDLMRMQNEALKRIYKNTLDPDKKE